MKVNRLQGEQEALGYSHHVKITHEDFTEATANTAQTLQMITVEAGEIVERTDLYLKVPFQDASDAAFNSSAATIGDGGSANRFLTSTELNVNGTEILTKAGTQTAGYAYVAGDTVDFVLNAMSGKALADLDVGEVHVFIKTRRLADLTR